VSQPISPILTITLVAMATSLERSEKEGGMSNRRSNTYHTYGENLMKIGPVVPKIIGLQEIIRKERN